MIKIFDFDRGYGAETKATGKDFEILELERKLLSKGYQVGSMVSDFRASYLMTDAPLNIVKDVSVTELAK